MYSNVHIFINKLTEHFSLKHSCNITEYNVTLLFCFCFCFFLDRVSLVCKARAQIHRVAGHIVSTVSKQWSMRVAIKPQGKILAAISLQQGSISQRFHNLAEQQHQGLNHRFNYMSLWRHFTFKLKRNQQKTKELAKCVAVGWMLPCKLMTEQA